MEEDKEYDSEFDKACDKHPLLRLLVGDDAEELNHVMTKEKLKSILRQISDLSRDVTKAKILGRPFKYSNED